jgi:hypothetical protein
LGVKKSSKDLGILFKENCWNYGICECQGFSGFLVENFGRFLVVIKSYI